MMSDFLIISLEKFVIVISMMTDDLYTLPKKFKGTDTQKDGWVVRIYAFFRLQKYEIHLLGIYSSPKF